MDEKTVQAVALEQREYWKKSATSRGEWMGTQSATGRPSIGDIDPHDMNASDWVQYWNRWVSPEKSV